MHFFENAHPDQHLHGDVGPSVVRMVEGTEGLLVDQRQNHFPERPGPSPVEGCEALGGKVDIGSEDGFLRALCSEQLQAS
jgi:hypothetical protein